MDAENNLKFTTVRRSQRVLLDDKVYDLKELDGKGRDEYLNSVKDRTIVNSSGDVIGYKTYDGCQTDLLVKCLYDANGELVSADTIQMWPAATVNGLFNAAQELSSLTPDAIVGGQSKNV